MQISHVVLKYSTIVENLVVYQVSSHADGKEATSRQVYPLPLHPTRRYVAPSPYDDCEDKANLMAGGACSSLGNCLTYLSPWP